MLERSTQMSKFKEWIGEFLLRSLLLIGMIVVFSAGIYLSWRHTWHMAQQHGFTTDEAMIYTVLVETLMIVAELVVIFRAILGKPIHLSVYVGVGIAAIINLVGNVSSFWEVSKWGVALGASITLITAIAVWIFATALVDKTDNINQTKDKKSDSRQQTTSDSDKTDQTNHRQDNSDSADTQTDIERLDSMESVRKAVRQAKDSDKSRVRQSIDNSVDKDKTTHRQVIDNKDTQPIDTMIQTDAQTIDRQDKSATDIQTRQKTPLSVIDGGNQTQTDKEKLARHKALEYYHDKGKFPTYRELGEMVDMSKDKAGQIIKELKTKIS